MNPLTRYEPTLLDRLVAAKERRRRTRKAIHACKIPAYDGAVPPPEGPGRPVERRHAIVIDF